jgi:hypothetical protein
MLLTWASISSPSVAGIEKIMLVCDRGLCPYYWPQVDVPDGWFHDREASYQFDFNAIAPLGQTFSHAEAIIYGKAIYKPRQPETKSLLQLMAEDKERFEQKGSGAKVEVADALSTHDGQRALSYKFLPVTGAAAASDSDAQWERVAYLDDGEFYVIFVVSSRTEQGLAGANNAFEKAVASYTKEVQAK